MKQLEPCNDCGKTHPFFECDKPKPMTNEERIKADAERYTKDEGYQRVYIAGATAEHDRAQVLVDALEALKEGAENHTIHFIDKILKQWKSGKGKDEQVEECTCSLTRIVTHGKCYKCPELTNPQQSK